MSCIHYKFKSSLDYDSVTFDGLHLSLADLKKAISQKKRLKPGEFELEVTNAQTGDVYKKNDELIAKNTSVIVSRVPITKTTASSTQKSWEAFKQECAKVKEKERQMTLEKLKQTPDLASAPASEIDKIKAVIDQSTKGFEQSSFLGKHQTGVPHDTYVCRRCGQKGHYVTNCPNSIPEDRIIEPRYKRTTGIPSTMLTIVDDPLHPGALLTHHGQFAVPTVDVLGYRETKKERPPFLPGEKQPEPEKRKIPQELLCHICEDLCVDAAIAPCCGTSFCDECLREVLLESDDHQCPSCKETNVSPDRIVANRSMRLAVTNFLNGAGYTKVKRRRTMSSGGEQSQPLLPTPTTKSSPKLSSPKTETSPLSSPNINASPVYSDPKSDQKQDLSSTAPSSHSQTSQSHFSDSRNQSSYGYKSHYGSQYNHGRPPRFPANHYSKPWRYSNESSKEPGSISTISRRGDSDYSHYNSRPHADDKSMHKFNDGHTDKNESGEPPAPGTSPIADKLPVLSKPPNQWPQMPDNQSANLSNNAHTNLLTAAMGLLAHSMPLLNAPPPGHHAFPGLPGFPLTFPGLRPVLPMQQVSMPSVPLSKEEFYQAKKMLQQTEIPKKKPVDVFDSFADFTKRRSRTPERRRSYSRSRSNSWKRHSRSRSRSLSKGRLHSLSPRRNISRSRSRSGPRSQNRSRTRSPGPKRISRMHSRSRSPARLSKSRSRSRSGMRSIKPLSPRGHSPLPIRRSSKSPIRSRSRSYKRFSRSRSKSWTKRQRSRSYSPLLSRSPRRSRSPRHSPLRSPIRKRSFSPRRRSRSYSPRRYRSRTRSPIPKRVKSRSRTRSPNKRSPFSPIPSPRQSPYKKPLSPIPYQRRSPSPHRGRGGYRGSRGRGGYGYRDKFRNADKYRNYHSPPHAPPPLSTPVLSTTNLPPVPYNPQMGLPPPEEYFKYNPAGYQEFVRNFYSQFGPQAQAWAASQTFPLPSGDGITGGVPSNHFLPNQRPPWETVPMSPSHRPQSITPPNVTSGRERKDQGYRDNTRHWEKDRPERDIRDRPDRDIRDRPERDVRDRPDRDIRDRPERDVRDRPDRDVRDRRTDRGRDYDRFKDNERNRESDRYRDNERWKDIDRHGAERRDRTREDDRSKGRDGHRENKESTRSKDKPTVEKKKSPLKKAKDGEEKPKSKERKKSDRKKEEKENKKNKKHDSDARKEIAEQKEVLLKPITDGEIVPSAPTEKVGLNENAVEPSTNVKEETVSTDGTKAVVPEEQNQGDLVKSETEPEKPVIKDKKAVSKKKGEGLGGKKKTKDISAEDGGEKKGKKTRKKKLTFGSSEVDTKQGLKKKKLKRLVDYKSENCTSEEGEERSSLGGSPLKRAKLAELNQKNVDSGESVTAEVSHVTSSEPTFEVSTEAELGVEPLKVAEDETMVSQSEGDDKVADAGEDKSKEETSLELPEISKWERDDFDLFDAMDQPKEKPQEKMMLPRSVVDKAEKFLSHKPMKNAVMVAHVTTSTKSPESTPTPEKRVVEPSTSRRVFIDKKDVKDKKGNELQITVKTDKNKNDPKRAPTLAKSDDSRHRYHHHRHDDYEEDQRSVVKSRSLERELQEKSRAQKIKEKEKDKYSSKREEKRENRSSRDTEKRYESLRKDKIETSREKRDKSPEHKERRHSKDTPAGNSTETSKSSKDLRHKLEEKTKSKTGIDSRKLSVMDESEFVPDYEDMTTDNTIDNEHDEATTSQNSGASSSDSPSEAKKRKKNEDGDAKEGEGKSTDEEASGKHKKAKKKHKHKEKNKEKKEKHKHKKKKHKHKKSKEEKEGKPKTNKDDSS
ncbi:E3 ubiquitin-protein ligase RBBP6-like [Physella acuta]|uniref:E3 ubiquitin-protein ligase RBBP6-like n=1 Tax=Physella acuta TaxID=109671 RepID=UPI0027DC5747|nr:E3 ubiquitin-protein ligase RBBP6-like [Physella acuta]